MNGRSYRLSQMPDKRWELSRLVSIDATAGVSVGQYGSRGDASKALKVLAYAPEPRW